LPVAFRIQNCLKEGDAVLPFRRSKKIKMYWNLMGYIRSWSMLTMFMCWPKT